MNVLSADLTFPSVWLPASLRVHTLVPSWVVIECEVQSGAVEVTEVWSAENEACFHSSGVSV